MRDKGRRLERAVVPHHGFLLISMKEGRPVILAERGELWMKGGFGALKRSETDLFGAGREQDLSCRKGCAPERR